MTRNQTVKVSAYFIVTLSRKVFVRTKTGCLSYDNIDLIHADNWFPDRDATIVIIVIFQTNSN